MSAKYFKSLQIQNTNGLLLVYSFLRVLSNSFIDLTGPLK